MHTTLPDSVIVDGATIRYGVSGSGEHDIVLVHGNGAHHMWWHPIAPELEKHWRVITLDLSGHGDSDHRARYTPSLWVEEVRSVLDAVGSQRPLYVGHSMGGRAGISFATTHPDRLSGMVIFDSSVRPVDRYRNVIRVRERSATRTYPTREEALARFRLLPAQPAPPSEILDPLAEYSLKQVADGWSWKHDPRSLMRFNDAEIDELTQSLTCPIVYVYGSGSVVVEPDLAEYVRSAVKGPIDIIRIEDAYHHVILDAPEQCTRIIEDAATRFFAEDVSERCTSYTTN